jgi:hypothetical protein
VIAETSDPVRSPTFDSVTKGAGDPGSQGEVRRRAIDDGDTRDVFGVRSASADVGSHLDHSAEGHERPI